MVKNLPVNAGDTGLIPGPGGFYVPQSNEACVPQLLKPASLESALHNRRSRHSEKPVNHSEEQLPPATATKSVPMQQLRPSAVKNK